MKKLIWLFNIVPLLVLCPASFAYAQPDSVANPSIELSGFVDVFYAFDFNKPETNYRQPFFFHHNRHNEFNLNHGYVRVSVDHSRYRAAIALQAGTYVQDNYSEEPELLKNIFEANVGLSLNQNNTMWLDAGIFASHIGFESAVSMENWTLTRSLLADNSPYFLSGAKFTYTPTDNWMIAGLIYNGWQRIQRMEGNSIPSFGTQLKFTPTKDAIFNWSTFIGNDSPDSTRRMRYFNNFYLQHRLSEKISLIAGFDIGAEQQFKNSSSYFYWYAYSLILKHQVTSQVSYAARAEYYSDKNNVIIPVESGERFRSHAYSLTLDYSPTENIALRLEGRWLKSPQPLFLRENHHVTDNFFIVSSLAVRF
jgi:hypothetical protein